MIWRSCKILAQKPITPEICYVFNVNKFKLQPKMLLQKNPFRRIASSSIYIICEPKLYQARKEAVNCIWIDSEIDLPASGRLWKVSVMCGCLPAFSPAVTYSMPPGNKTKSSNEMMRLSHCFALSRSIYENVTDYNYKLQPVTQSLH